MIVNDLSFGAVTIDGETYGKDVIIDNGSVKKRNMTRCPYGKIRNNIFPSGLTSSHP